MAPINAVIDSTISTWSNVISSILVPLLLVTCGILLVLLCACCKSKKREKDFYYSTNPDSPDYCEDCAQWAHYGGPSPQHDRDDRWRRTNYPGHSEMQGTTERIEPKYFGVGRKPDKRRKHAARTHRFNYEESKRPVLAPSIAPEPQPAREYKSPLSPLSDKPRPDKQRSTKEWKETSSRGRGRSGKEIEPEPKPKPDRTMDPVEFVSPRNPKYKTLFIAQSNVFDKEGAKKPVVIAQDVTETGGIENRMKAAQMNPAYKTLYQAKSGIFDKPGGGQDTKPAATMVPNEEKMRAAAMNPAYKTLWNAKTRIFDKKSGLTPPKEHDPGSSVGYRA